MILCKINCGNNECIDTNFCWICDYLGVGICLFFIVCMNVLKVYINAFLVIVIANANVVQIVVVALAIVAQDLVINVIIVVISVVEMI